MMVTGKTLFAVVDVRDPFAPSLIDGEQQAGTILSLMATQPFDLLFLFYNPTTQPNAHETSREVNSRYPDCKVVLLGLPDSSLEDPFSFVRKLSRQVREATRMSRDTEKHLCMSSGTPEMRAALFFLVTAGVLPASLLHASSPAERLFAPLEVKEIKLDEPDGSNILRAPQDIEIQMELMESELSPASTGRYPGLDLAVKAIPIYIHSAAMQAAVEDAAKVAPTDIPILILGESGTGKELFAKLIHRLSNRRDKALVVVNCAAMPRDVMESELFGSVKGAFTGALNRIGSFGLADKSTIFLDEIGELPTNAQAKLLRVLQEKEFQRLGSPQVQKVDVRIVAATNQDLQKRMSDGEFRPELYHRLSGFELYLPPLRERYEEIPALAVRLLERICEENQREKRLSKKSLARLMQHSWPGNVRELDNVLRRAWALAEHDVIEPENLVIGAKSTGEEYLRYLPVPGTKSDMKTIIRKVKSRLVKNALSACNNNHSRAAELLGISRQALSQFLSEQDGGLA